MDIEARIDQRRDAGFSGEIDQDVVVERVCLAPGDLRPRGPVDMDYRLDALAPFRSHLGRYRHEPAGIGVAGGDVEDARRIGLRHHRRERHEFGSRQPPVQFVMHRAPARVGEDRACP
jgi:hypothetical protein